MSVEGFLLDASWLWDGGSFWHWLGNTAIDVTVGFFITAALLAPGVKWLKNKLNPATPGGVGDIVDAEGVPAWKRAQEHSQPHHH